MLEKIKQAVKASMVQGKIEEYYMHLDEQFVSYHSWITEREAQYRASMKNFGKNELCRISVGYNETCDIVILTTDEQFLDPYASEVISNYFCEYPECMLLYGDEDEWNSNRTIRMNPWFKPDFSPELLCQYFYFGNVIALRRSYLDSLEGWKEMAESGQNMTTAEMYELCLRAAFPVERGKIGHVPYVLYHAPRLEHLCAEEKTSTAKKDQGEEVSATKKDQGEEVSAAKKNQEEEVSAAKKNQEGKITIVIPTKDHPEILQTCLESIENTAKNSNYEIIVVDNGSKEENQEKYEGLKVKYKFNYIFKPMEFHFSGMCNLGAEHATGQILLFLNDDIEAMEEGWLEHMKKQVIKPHVGAVGAKLYYPDSKMIQHAGITNLRLGPVHKLQFLEDVRPYYDGRNRLDCNVIAVTGACLMVRRDVFEECGGFSQDLAVAFNDVELCFRIYKKGYYNVVCNSVALYHHESLSRGGDDSEEKLIRLQNERHKMYAMHPDLYGKDPFYHPYLNTVILDTHFSHAYEYPAGADVAVEEPVQAKQPVKEEWYNECLQISLEYAGELASWIEEPGKKGEYLYFQGYQFVIGSENPEFARYLLCREEKTGMLWEIPCIPTFRPDLDKNVSEGHASLCGFGLVVEKKGLPKGKYRIGAMAKSRIGRQILCKFTNKFVEID